MWRDSTVKINIELQTDQDKADEAFSLSVFISFYRCSSVVSFSLVSSAEGVMANMEIL